MPPETPPLLLLRSEWSDAMEMAVGARAWPGYPPPPAGRTTGGSAPIGNGGDGDVMPGSSTEGVERGRDGW